MIDPVAACVAEWWGYVGFDGSNEGGVVAIEHEGGRNVCDVELESKGVGVKAGSGEPLVYRGFVAPERARTAFIKDEVGEGFVIGKDDTVVCIKN